MIGFFLRVRDVIWTLRSDPESDAIGMVMETQPRRRGAIGAAGRRRRGCAADGGDEVGLPPSFPPHTLLAHPSPPRLPTALAL